MTGASGGAAVLRLGEIRAGDAARVGPKMARLGQLAADGWRVPDGYVVTAGALAGWLPPAARAELERLFATAPGVSGHAELRWLAERARSLVTAQSLPSALADAVRVAHAALEQRSRRGAALRVAVRSSAVSEDGHAASFAGQYETYLGIRGVVDVLAHVRECWASGFSAHALSYRQRLGGASPLRAHDLAVGVLELVDARSAGVAFTLDPVTGDRGVCVIEGNWGFGESVVSGHVSPDHWTVDRATGRVLTARVGAKRTWAITGGAGEAADGAGPRSGRVALTALPDDLAGRLCLTEDEVRHIATQAAAIEEASGGVPQDIEWAVARDAPFPDSVFIVQHRPETTWTGAGPGTATAPTPGASGSAGPAPAPQAFDPVRYALRNVFKVPGA